ncbi:MAG TPA: sigma-70 family RNA polymerase sigma factor [Chthoniobacterales bacterium]|nr:sigma-70 family RNA polymerase sigma factor [Chthoniobacterales bacterium]
MSRNPPSVSFADPRDATQILQSWSNGDQDAALRLMPLVYEELHRRAAACFQQERPDHTLQATALVHESYLKLIKQRQANWKSRAHFCRFAAQLMRRILVQHARTHNRQKRGGGWEKIYLDETRELGSARNPDLVELEEVLNEFTELYPREAQVVELKFFGGLDVDQIAHALNTSPRTVKRDWSFARTWLCRELTENAA